MPEHDHRLNGSWTSTTLGTFCKAKGALQTGPFGSQLHASDYTDVGVPVVMPQDIGHGRIHEEHIARVPEAIAKRLRKHMLKEGDVVFSRRGEINRFAIVSKKESGWLCGTGCLRARLDGGLNPHFLGLLLDSHAGNVWLLRNAVGQTMLNLNTDIVARFPLALPSPVEQKALADLVRLWNRASHRLLYLIKARRKLKRGLLQQLLTGERRFPEFRDQPWVERRFGDFLMESRIPGSHGAAAKKLSIRLYGKGMYVRTDNRDGSEQTQYYRRSAGQLVYSKLDFLNGAFGIVPASLDGYESTLDVPAFDIASDTDPRWLLYLVTFDSFYKRQLGLAHGGRKARRVNPDAFLGLALPMPTRAEQARIADALEDADREIQLLTDLNEALKEQKKGLMQQLLTGRVRVPASMLKKTSAAGVQGDCECA